MSKEAVALPFIELDTTVIRKARRLDQIALANAVTGSTTKTLDSFLLPTHGIGKALALAKILRDPDFFAGGIGYINTPDSGKRFVKKSFHTSATEAGTYAGSKDILIAPGEDIKPERRTLAAGEESSPPIITDRFASIKFSLMTEDEKKEFLDLIDAFIKAPDPAQFLKEKAAEVMLLEASEELATAISAFDFVARQAQLEVLYKKEITRQRAINGPMQYDMSQYFVRRENANGVVCQPTYKGRLAIADYYKEKLGIEIIPTPSPSSTVEIINTMRTREGNFKVGILASTDEIEGNHKIPIIYEKKDGVESIYVSDSVNYDPSNHLINLLQMKLQEVMIKKIGTSNRQADNFSCVTDGISFLKEMLTHEITEESAFLATAKRAQRSRAAEIPPDTAITTTAIETLKKHRDKHTALSMNPWDGPIIQNLALNEKGYFYQRLVAGHLADKTAEEIKITSSRHTGIDSLIRALNGSGDLNQKVKTMSALLEVASNIDDSTIVDNWIDANPELAVPIIIKTANSTTTYNNDVVSLLKKIHASSKMSSEIQVQAAEALFRQVCAAKNQGYNPVELVEYVQAHLTITPERMLYIFSDMKLPFKAASSILTRYSIISRWHKDTLNQAMDTLCHEIASSSGHNKLLSDVIEANNTEIANALIEKMKPEDLILTNKDGQTALHLAAYANSTEIANALIEKMKPEDLIIINKAGQTALHLAAYTNSTEIANALIAKMKPEDLIITNKAGQTALHLAASKDCTKMAKTLIAKMKPEDLILTDKDGQTALHLAAQNRYRTEDIVNTLIAKMKSEDLILTNKDGQTALHLAVCAGSTELANALIAKMKPEALDIKDENGKTALHLAVRAGNTDIVNALIAKMNQIDLVTVDENGHTAFDYANTSTKRILTLAVLKDLPPHKVMERIAAKPLTMRFLDAETITSYLNRTDSYGVTNFSKIIKYGDEKLVQAALNLGADPTLLSRAGSPTAIAQKAKVNSRIQTMLSQALTAQDTTAATPSLMSRLCCSRRVRSK